ncbi:MAG: PAS domain S-box protein [Balneolales bacterium]
MLNAKNARSVFKASPHPQIILGADPPLFTVVDVNEAYLQITGAVESHFIDKPFFEAFTTDGEPSDVAGEKVMRAALKRVVTQKKAQILDVQKYNIPVWGTRKVAQRYWAPKNYPVLDEDGNILYIIHAPVDVTEKVLVEQKKKKAREELRNETLNRERAERQLLKEKEVAESLINNHPGMFFLFDRQGKFYRWNNNLEELTGYTADEVEKMHPLKFIPDEYLETFKKTIDKAFARGKAEVEAALLVKDGKIIPFFFEGIAIELDGKDYILGTGSDISELVKERTERMYLSQVLEKSRNEIYITDENTMRFIYVNEGARENLGYSFEDLQEMSPLDVIAENSQMLAEQFVKPLIDGVTDRTVFNTVHRRADGSLYDVEVYLQRIEQGDYKLFVAIILDITERLKAEAQIKASLQEKEVLLNEIHHRVKNNLAIISSLLRLQASSVGDENFKGILKESEGRIQAMAMIHELLYHHEDFSSIDFGIYLKKLMQQIKINHASPDKTIQVQVKADPVNLEINKAVPCALIAYELITNAYKHAFKGRNSGRISITLHHSNGTATLIISDNGIGLPQKKKSSTMGLMLTHGLTRQIGGTLSSQTQNGTTFSLTFAN